MIDVKESSPKDLFETILREHINISYTGPFDSNVLSVLAKNIEFSLSLDPKLNKKVFKIFIELAQNIAFYSAERAISTEGENMGVGIFIIKEFDDNYIFSTGNLATKRDIQPVMEKCNAINSMDREALREYKRQQRNLPPSEKVALTADNPLEYGVVKITEEHYFYIISVKINKYGE